MKTNRLKRRAKDPIQLRHPAVSLASWRRRSWPRSAQDRHFIRSSTNSSPNTSLNFLNDASESEADRRKMERGDRWFRLAYVAMGAAIFCVLTWILLPDNSDLYFQLLQGLGIFVAGSSLEATALGRIKKTNEIASPSSNKYRIRRNRSAATPQNVALVRNSQFRGSRKCPTCEKLRSTLADGTTSADVLRVRAFRGRNGRFRGPIASARWHVLPQLLLPVQQHRNH